MTEQRIIRFEEVDPKLQKYLNGGKDTVFMFECEVMNDSLRLGLKEINCYSPYYYEAFYSLEELQKKNNVFKSCQTLEIVKDHLMRLFPLKEQKIESLDEGAKIKITLHMFDISIRIEECFELNRKITDSKDDALMFLFNIQKNNYNLFDRIKNACQGEDNEDTREIIKLCQDD